MRSSLEFTENILEEKVKRFEEQCENIETELKELDNNQIDSEYVYNIDPKDATYGLMVLLNVLEEKVKNFEEQCENIETKLKEFYNNQIDPEYVYKMDPKDAAYRLMVLLKGKVKLENSVKVMFKIFLRKNSTSKALA